MVVAMRRLYAAAVCVAVVLWMGPHPPASCQPEGREMLHFLALLPFEIPDAPEQPSYLEGPNILPGAELAVEQINRREDILAGYTVNLTVANTACNLQDYTLINFVESFFYSGNSFVGIIGPTCSDAAELVLAIPGESEISTLNFHIVSSPRLSNREQFGYSFGTVGSSHGYVKMFLSLMERNDWHSVAVFYEESKIFYATAYSLLIDRLQQTFPQGNIAFSAPISETYLPVSSISDHRVRVIFILSTSDLMHKIFCLITRRFSYLKFPTYQFVLMEVRSFYFYYPADFTYNGQRYMCSVREITEAMEGTLFTHVQLELTNQSSVLVSGVTYGEYRELYRERVVSSLGSNATTEWANPFYDGVWSLALALNNSIPKLQERGFELSNYTMGNPEASMIIRDEVVRLNFQGASGPVLFDNTTGYTEGTIELDQLVDNSSNFVGTYAEDTDELRLTGSPDFIEGDFESMELLVHPVLATLFLLLTLIALTLIVVVHVLTLVYRDFKPIKASSYRLSQLIFIGCYALVLSTFALTIEKTSSYSSVSIPSLCAIQAWCLPISLTLILGSVTLKTWRLYRIFVHLKKPGKLLSDWSLIIMVLLLVGVDVVVCLSWTIAFPFTILRHETIQGINEIDVTVECDSEHYFAWFGALTLFQGLLMLTALALALLTKGIRHESFKTKAVVLLVYFLTITLLLGLPTYFILQVTNVSGPNTEYAVLALTLNIVLYLCFSLLFFPPVLSLLRAKVFHKVPGLKRFSTTITSYDTSTYYAPSFATER